MADAVSDDGSVRLLGALGVGYVQGTTLSEPRPAAEVDVWQASAALHR